MKRLSLYYFLFLVSLSCYGQNLDSLDQYISKAVIDWNVPGLAVSIVKDGKVVLSKGYGVKEMGKTEKVDQNTLFAIASNTKAFIATSLGILVEQKKLNWDDPVQKFLPYFALYDPYVSANTTVKDLLCHRVGLGTFSGDVIWYKSNFSPEEVLKRAKYLPQAYPFRAGYGYTNLMFLAAGEVIQKVSGKSWFDFIKENIGNPIGMKRTVYSTNDLTKMGNYATPHKSIYSQLKPIPWTNWDNMGAAGGILSSADDMAKWMQLNLAGGTLGTKTVIHPSIYDELWSLQNSNKITVAERERAPSTNFNGYGLGWVLQDLGGHLIVSHSGGYDGMYSQVMMIPSQKLGVTILSNSMTGISSALSRHIIERYLKLPYKDRSKSGLENELSYQKSRKVIIDKKKEAQIKGTKPSELSFLLGKYFDPMYGEVIIKSTDGKNLQMLFPHAPALRATLKHFHYDTYEIVWNEEHAWYDYGTVQFVFDNEHKSVTSIQFDVPNEDIFFEEIKAKKID
jgi:CubicO group peptidase (beta-lactamase class C family)